MAFYILAPKMQPKPNKHLYIHLRQGSILGVFGSILAPFSDKANQTIGYCSSLAVSAA